MKATEYTKGSHYSEYLQVDNDYNKTTTRVTKVKQTKYGYIFHMFNHYITLYYGKLFINPDGSAKARIKVMRNYCPTYYETHYFDLQGYEIKAANNNTRTELAIYNRLRNN